MPPQIPRLAAISFQITNPIPLTVLTVLIRRTSRDCKPIIVNGISRAGSDYTLSLDTRIYSILAIKKTAYKFADRVSIVLRPEEGSKLLVAFNFCDTQEKNDPEKVISDFCNELIDQDLRDIIKKETEPVKNLILAHAFSKTKLVDGNS